MFDREAVAAPVSSRSAFLASRRSLARRRLGVAATSLVALTGLALMPGCAASTGDDAAESVTNVEQAQIFQQNWVINATTLTLLKSKIGLSSTWLGTPYSDGTIYLYPPAQLNSAFQANGGTGYITLPGIAPITVANGTTLGTGVDYVSLAVTKIASTSVDAQLTPTSLDLVVLADVAMRGYAHEKAIGIPLGGKTFSVSLHNLAIRISFDIPTTGDFMHSLHVASTTLTIDPANIGVTNCTVFGVVSCAGSVSSQIQPNLNGVGASLTATLNDALSSPTVQPAFESVLKAVANASNDGSPLWSVVHDTAVLTSTGINYTVRRAGKGLPITTCSVHSNRCSGLAPAQLTSCTMAWPTGGTFTETTMNYSLDEVLVYEQWDPTVEVWTAPVEWTPGQIALNSMVRICNRSTFCVSTAPNPDTCQSCTQPFILQESGYSFACHAASAGTAIPGSACPIQYNVTPSYCTVIGGTGGAR